MNISKQSEGWDIGLRKYIREHLALKIFLLTAILLFSVSGFIYGMIALGVSRNYLAELDKSLDMSTKNLVSQLSEVSEQEMESLLNTYALEHGLSITLLNQNGTELKSFGEVAYRLDADTDTEKYQKSKGITKTYSMERENGTVYQLLVFGTKQRTNAALNSLNQIFPIAAVFAILVSVVIAVFYSRYVTRPILKVSEASKRLADMDFQIQCPNNRSDEIGILGENLNRLAEELNVALEELKEKNLLLEKDILLEKQMEQQQLAFFSAVSHELKTPVTILKGQLQGMLYGVGGYKDRDKYLRRSFEVADSMDGMIQEILSVSKIKSSGFVLNRTAISLDGMVQDILCNMEDIAIDKGICLHSELLSNANICVDKELFEKAVSNLIGNAIKYTADNGNIWVRIFQDKDAIILSVENETEKIPEGEIPKLFEPFYRRDKSRSRKTGGSGLGLYIVKMVMDLHRFAYQFHNTESGVEIKIICK